MAAFVKRSQFHLSTGGFLFRNGLFDRLISFDCSLLLLGLFIESNGISQVLHSLRVQAWSAASPHRGQPRWDRLTVDLPDA